MWIKIIIFFFLGTTVAYVLFFAFATSIGTTTVLPGQAGVRLGWGSPKVVLGGTTGTTMGGSMMIHRMHCLELEQVYPMHSVYTIKTKDQKRLQVQLDWSWKVIPTEAAILTLIETLGYKKGTDASKLQRALDAPIKKALKQLAQTHTASDWLEQPTLLYQALVAQVDPASYGYQITVGQLEATSGS